MRSTIPIPHQPWYIMSWSLDQTPMDVILTAASAETTATANNSTYSAALAVANHSSRLMYYAPTSR